MAGLSCEERGHEWIANTDFCQRCGISFEDYRNGLDKKYNPLPKCECGANVAGFDTHTHYCPRSEKK